MLMSALEERAAVRERPERWEAVMEDDRARSSLFDPQALGPDGGEAAPLLPGRSFNLEGTESL